MSKTIKKMRNAIVKDMVITRKGGVMKDKREKRQNRKSWKNEIE